MKFQFLPENFSRSENAPPFETRKIRHFEVERIFLENKKMVQEKFALPDDEEKAALLFLQRLTTLGYATFVLDADEVDLEHPIPPMQGNPKKQVLPAR